MADSYEGFREEIRAILRNDSEEGGGVSFATFAAGIRSDPDLVLNALVSMVYTGEVTRVTRATGTRYYLEG